MRFGFDLDEVVVDLTAEIEKYIELNYGIVWPSDYFVNYDFIRCKFSDDGELNARIIEDLFEVVNSSEFQFQAEPFENACEVLRKLKHANHKLFFITSRPVQNQPLTFKWLRKWDIPFDGLKVIGHNQPKGQFGMRLKLDMYVDDLEKHLISMNSYKKRWRKGLLLLDKPWNRYNNDGSKFKRVKNWNDILRHVGVQNR